MQLPLRLLHHLYPDSSSWEITRPSEGRSKETYFATSASQKLFIKFDVHADTLLVLSSLGLCPPLLTNGEFEGRLYIIQTYVDGYHPDTTWIIEHLDACAALISSYHHAPALSRILEGFQTSDYVTHLHEELDNLSASLLRLPAVSSRSTYQPFLDTLKISASILSSCPLVPVLPDPNKNNFIITPSQVYIVDWDDVLLSDPLRDISLFLCNNAIPLSHWDDFLKHTGIPPSVQSHRRFYWWLTWGELNIALWYEARTDHASATLYLSHAQSSLASLSSFLDMRE